MLLDSTLSFNGHLIVLCLSQFYTSHEGLLLNYEAALTERCEDGSYIAKSAHFLWIGDRTRDLLGAHVEFFRGISNPIGVKIGPTMQPAELVSLVQVLNPRREQGRLTLITRYGAEKVGAVLPAHAAAVRESGVPVVWCCDPCHGNTEIANVCTPLLLWSLSVL